jgi:excisionase family DNA binding protein
MIDKRLLYGRSKPPPRKCAKRYLTELLPLNGSVPSARIVAVKGKKMESSNSPISDARDREYRTKADIADWLGVSTRTIDQKMADGSLPYLKIGRTVRFHVPTVAAHLAKNFSRNV